MTRMLRTLDKVDSVQEEKGNISKKVKILKKNEGLGCDSVV
jgi:hypothetical protein